MASGANALALSTLVAIVNTRKNVPMSSTAYFRPATAAAGTTAAATGEASGGASVYVMMSMTSRVVSQRAPVVRGNAHLRSRPAGVFCIPASCNMPVVPLPQRRSTRQVRLDTPERAAWLPTIIAASRNLGLQPTVSAHGRWRRRRTERPRLILEGMTLLCSRCCQSPSRPSWSATVSTTVLQFPFHGAAGASPTAL
jgi:hypothetical protein